MTEQQREVLDRAIVMLRVAGKHCETHAASRTSYYDGARCDGYCIKQDCEAAAEALGEIIMGVSA